jgi:hypothetical protein
MDAKQVIARYSILKVGTWIVVAGAAAGWLVMDGASRGWRVPDFRFGWLFPVALAGSAILFLTAVALLVNFALGGGTAIAKIGEEFVLYRPFGRTRVALAGATIDVGLQRATASGSNSLPDIMNVAASQVIIMRPAQPNITFRTGLLRESATVIADRMSAFLR